MDLLFVSAKLEDVSTAWMDENISVDDCSGHAFERPELGVAPINQRQPDLNFATVVGYGSGKVLVHDPDPAVAASS